MEALAKSERWQLLPHEKTGIAPDLFYSFANTGDGFRLLLTDLIYVWKCTEGKDEVIKTARDQNCSIDPSESSSQFKTLILKLEDSLGDGTNALARPRTEADGAFELHTRTNLPAPLQPLQWTFRLNRMHVVNGAYYLALPCLEELSASAQKLEKLFQVIKEKDHVITKLLDKIEGSAIDLSLIFPGITVLKSRKHHVSVAEASKHVPGMATFDRDAWTARNTIDFDDEHSRIWSLSHAVDQIDVEESYSRASENWQLALPATPHTTARMDTTKRLSEKRKREEDPREAEPSGNSSDGDFENQHFTPSKKSDVWHDKNITGGRVSTDSDSDSDHSTRPASKPSKQDKLGALGYRKSASKRTSMSTAAVKVRSETDLASSPNSDTEAPQSKTKAKPKLNSKLGLIGGRRMASPARPPSPPPLQVRSNASTPSRRLGVVGGHHTMVKTPTKSQHTTPSKPSPSPVAAKASHTKEDDSDTTISPTPSPSPPATKVSNKSLSPYPARTSKPPAPTETDEEAAARRREELKQTLNSGGAAKKKRKF